MTILRLSNVHTFYDDSHVLQGVSIDVDQGSIVAILGRNGAGKTTTMRSVTGVTPPREGSIEYRGARINGMRPHRIARLGIGLVPQGRRIFPSLSVEENLRVPVRRRRAADRDAAMGRVFEQFPALAERRRSRGGTLSGGEQQMLAIGRTLMLEPDVLLLDEPSEGLSPGVVAQIRGMLLALRGAGTTIVIVEQIVDLALGIADDVYILERGAVVYHSTPAALRADPEAMRTHLGLRR